MEVVDDNIIDQEATVEMWTSSLKKTTATTVVITVVITAVMDGAIVAIIIGADTVGLILFTSRKEVETRKETGTINIFEL